MIPSTYKTRALDRLPRQSGFVFRHYHLDPEARAARFAELAERARENAHRVILSGTADQADFIHAQLFGGPARSFEGWGGVGKNLRALKRTD